MEESGVLRSNMATSRWGFECSPRVEVYLASSSAEKHVTSVELIGAPSTVPSGCRALHLSGEYRRPLPRVGVAVQMRLLPRPTDGGHAAREYAAFAEFLHGRTRAKGPKAAVVAGLVVRTGGDLVPLRSAVVVARPSSSSSGQQQQQQLELVLMLPIVDGGETPPSPPPLLRTAQAAAPVEASVGGMLSLEAYLAAVESGRIKTAYAGKGGPAAKYAQGWSFHLPSRRWKKRGVKKSASPARLASAAIAAKDARIEELLEQLSGLTLNAAAVPSKQQVQQVQAKPKPKPPAYPPPPQAVVAVAAASVSFHFIVFDTNMLIDQVGEFERAFVEFREQRLAAIRRLEADLAAVNRLMAAPRRSRAAEREPYATPALNTLSTSPAVLHCNSILVPNWVLRELDGLKKSSRPYRQSSSAATNTTTTTTVGTKARWAGKVLDGLLAAGVIVHEQRRRELAESWSASRVHGSAAKGERPERAVRRKLLRALDILTAVPLVVGQRAHELFLDSRGGLHAEPARLRADDAILNCCIYFTSEEVRERGGAPRRAAEWCQRWGVSTTIDVDGRALHASLARSTVALCSRDCNFRTQAAIHGIIVQQPLASLPPRGQRR